ncbi:MAG: type III pantothenate kinase [Bacteroidales bacterium]
MHRILKDMELAVDIGNSLIKAGLFKNNKLFKVVKFKDINFNRLTNFALHYSVENIIISSVRENSFHKFSRLKKFFKKIIELNETTKLPIRNLYKTPETLGKDRIAGAVGAYTIFPDDNVLYIDMGSAITIDLINNKGEYIGGNITPGLKMRYNALHQFTNKLPLLQPKENKILLGQTTQEAIHAGMSNGIIFELNSYIKTLQGSYDNLKTILTGGDSNFFDNKLNYTIFVESNLILIGLNKILKYNIYED